MDGLRAIAVIFVMIHHFEATIPMWINWGTLGVRFFFVLSGFLITRILLKSRERVEQGKVSWLGEFNNFQMRRLIRTLPTYYLALGIGALLAIPPVRETLVWTLTFLTNILIIKTGWFPHTISHFWSLAVQEQFYLVWPWLIFFLPKRGLKVTLALLIFSGVTFRYGCIVFHVTEVLRWVSLPASLDTFAVGGILAYVSMSRPCLLENHRTRFWTGLVAFGLIWLARDMRSLPLEDPRTVIIELLEAIFMGWVVACSVRGFEGIPGKILSAPPLVYLGKISYGIYVYHILVVILLNPWLDRIGLRLHVNDPFRIRFLVQMLATVAVATLSWRYFEQPLLKARDKIADWFRDRAARRAVLTGE